MASPDTSPENPHRIFFSNETLGVSIEINLAHPGMENLEPRDRELLETLVRAEAYTLAITLQAKETMPHHEWRNNLIHGIDDQFERVYFPEEYLPFNFLSQILGFNLVKPSLEPEIRELPSSQSA